MWGTFTTREDVRQVGYFLQEGKWYRVRRLYYEEAYDARCGAFTERGNVVQDTVYLYTNTGCGTFTVSRAWCKVRAF